MAVPIDSLVTRVSPDKGYSGEPPTAGGLRGFVCPRANAYGGRDGIIPPGVAAQHGLVPVLMRRVSVGEVAASADRANRDGKTEAQRYMEYYGGSIRGGDVRMVGMSATVSDGVVTRRQVVVSAPGRMFSRSGPAPVADDTLDAFYDTLGSGVPGTGEGMEGDVIDAEEPSPSQVKAASVQPQVAMRSVGSGADAEAVVRLADELAELRGALSAATSELDSVRAERDGLEGRVLAAESELAALRDSQQEGRKGEQVRVVLSAPEEKLKIGGDHWECNILGSLHFSRTGNTVVLTVSDMKYASELMAELSAGEVVIVSKSGRTYCTYDGDCAKLYGEPDSGDFIACIRMSCSG